MGEPYEGWCAKRSCASVTCALAGNFIDFGFTVLMDQLMTDRTELALLAPRPVRNATRDADESWVFEGYQQLDANMRRNAGGVGWWFDTSALTPEETAEQLVRNAATLQALSY